MPSHIIPAAYLYAVSGSSSGALSLQVFGSSFRRLVKPMVSDLAIFVKSETSVLSDAHWMPRYEHIDNHDPGPMYCQRCKKRLESDYHGAPNLPKTCRLLGLTR